MAKKTRSSIKPSKRPFFIQRSLVSAFAKLFITLLCILAVLVIYQSTLLQKKFSGKRWSLPAYVYARPLELYPQQEISPRFIIEELKALGYQHRDSLDEPASYSYSANSSGHRIKLFKRAFQFPEGIEPERKIELFIKNGVIQSLHVAEQSADFVRIEPLKIGAIYPKHHQDRILVKISELPPLLINMLLVIEDRQFYEHHGLAFRSILRAFVVNLKAGRARQGGSTITQQLVKNFFLNHRKTLGRKIHEAFLALLLEFHYDKNDILEAYFNEIYLGQDGKRAIHGFGLASEFYFGRPLQDLDISQMATLVGMVKGPSYYNPFKNPDRATERRNVVLKEMARHDLITEKELNLAIEQPLGLLSSAYSQLNAYPSFLQFVHRQLLRDYPPEYLKSEGLRIFTTLDPIVQDVVKNTVRDQLSLLEHKHQLSPGFLDSAVIFTNRQNGEIVAFLGGRFDDLQGFNRALDTQRPIGSLIKPIVYLAALTTGKYTVASWLDDEPITVKQHGSPDWLPENYDRKSHGKVMLFDALAHSYNLATVHLGMDVGISETLSMLSTLGTHHSISPLPSVLLGAVSLSPIQVTQLYQVLASGGFLSPMRTIRTVLTPEGQISSRYPTTVEARIKPELAFLTHFMLSQVMQRGTGRSVYNSVDKNTLIGGKTGTTNDMRDSWFAGYTHRYLGVVWMGNDQNNPTPLTGSAGALRIWTEVIKKLSPRSVLWPKPLGIDWYMVDSSPPGVVSSSCANVLELPFVVDPGLASSECHVKHIKIRGRHHPNEHKTFMKWLKDFF